MDSPEKQAKHFEASNPFHEDWSKVADRLVAHGVGSGAWVRDLVRLVSPKMWG